MELLLGAGGWFAGYAFPFEVDVDLNAVGDSDESDALFIKLGGASTGVISQTGDWERASGGSAAAARKKKAMRRGRIRSGAG